MKKLLGIVVLGLLVNSCGSFEPTGTVTGNSNEVYISNQGLGYELGQTEAFQIANRHCQQYGKEAYSRGYYEYRYIFGCK